LNSAQELRSKHWRGALRARAESAILREGSERHYRVGGGRVIETEFGSLAVPSSPSGRAEARIVFGICSILIFKDVEAAVVRRNVVCF
jgi:hypothetical protein